MTPNVNYYERIDDYCLDLLDAAAKAEFESEMERDAKLREEVKLRMEIQSAIAELDVADLRSTLKNVASQNHTSSEANADAFELFTDFSDFDELSEELSSEELINFFDSMPKVHVHQHEMTSNENTHHFYKEQEEAMMEMEGEDMDDLDMDEFEGLEEAILEKDIINFRNTLSQVAKSVEPQFTLEEIDEFLNDELEEEALKEFESELELNSSLQNEIELHKELESAIGERDVMDLRSQVSHIMDTETSWNVSEESIEAFIDGELDGDALHEFRAELNENSDLKAELKLREQVNEFIGEEDIQQLRAELKAAQSKVEESKVRRFIPEANQKIVKFIQAGAAVMVLLIGIASLLNSGYLSTNGTYDNFYDPPQWASERSVSTDYSFIQRAQVAYMSEDFEKVKSMSTTAPLNVKNNPVFQFYLAASLQNIGKYNEAAEVYSKVIDHADNLYMEEAEWYRSLCYIKGENKHLAKQELLAVVERKGHYKQDAKAILRRLRFSLE